MKRLSLTFRRSEDGDSIYDAVACEQGRQREAAIFSMDVLADGSILELVSVEGERDEVAAAFDAWTGVLHYDVFASRARHQYALVHVEQDDRVLELLSLLRDHGLILDLPVEFRADGATVTLVGDERAIRRAFAAFPPEAKRELEVERFDEYVPDAHDLRSALTERQLDVLETAVEAGYYADPRNATVTDVADALGISQSTASEHLRKIEARVFEGLVGRPGRECHPT